jgi:hypothetical protein
MQFVKSYQPGCSELVVVVVVVVVVAAAAVAILNHNFTRFAWI